VNEGAAVWLVRFHVPDYGREALCRDAVAVAVLRALQTTGLDVARPARDLRVARQTPVPAWPQRTALLRRIELFHDLSAEERAELKNRMREHVVPCGGTVVRQGEAGESLFVLAEGVLDVKREEGDGTQVVLDRMVPGEVFGEMSLLTGQPRSATVIAATEAMVFEIEKAHLDPLLRRRPELAEGLAGILAARQAHNVAYSDRHLDGPAAPDGLVREDLLGRLRTFFRLR
jgi:hypothetical protein